MSRINTKIDSYVRCQRRKTIFEVSVIIIPAIFILIWFFSPPLGKVSDIEGVIDQFILLPSDEGDLQYMMVKLPNGSLVRTKVYKGSSLKTGSEVVLQVQEPLLLGKKVYRLKRVK